MESDAPSPENEQTKLEKRFEVALQIRNMEIELFWKRSAFYWVFVGVALVAYGAINDDKPQMGMLIGGFGFLSSVTWLLGNIGSKWWIENWEQKLKQTACPIVGDLFVPSQERFQILPNFILARFSVTRLTILLSVFVSILWLCILFMEMFKNISWMKDVFSCVYEFRNAVIPLIVIVFFISFFRFAYGSDDRKEAGKSIQPTNNSSSKNKSRIV